ncbi:MAG: hypothetical protein QF464_24805, partial [Myxococcota bacterium]|nr:hypothetical protein [Myxococcota bacterium]
CDFTAHEGTCDDGNPCTLGDHCASGACAVTEMAVCDDGNPCTSDHCDPLSGCESAAVEGPCSDGDACTVGDVCDAGTCVGQAALGCDDGNPCTDDSCDTALGCVHVDNDAGCDDDNACTLGDLCVAGACVGGSAPDCDDDNGCTIDGCDIVEGCRNNPVALVCDDGDACT